MSPSREDFAGRESGPSAEDLRDGLAEQDTAGGLEHPMKIDQFEAFISRLSMRVRLRVLGLLDVHAVRPLVKIPTIRSDVGLPRGSPGSGALSTGNFPFAAGGCPFREVPRECDFANLGPVKLHAPPL